MFYVALTNTQKSEFRILLTLIPLGWRGWGRDTHHITVGRGMPIKKVFFSESVWNGYNCFVTKNLGRE